MRGANSPTCIGHSVCVKAPATLEEVERIHQRHAAAAALLILRRSMRPVAGQPALGNDQQQEPEKR
jgi:hypothetical protein